MADHGRYALTPVSHRQIGSHLGVQRWQHPLEDLIMVERSIAIAEKRARIAVECADQTPFVGRPRLQQTFTVVSNSEWLGSYGFRKINSSNAQPIVEVGREGGQPGAGRSACHQLGDWHGEFQRYASGFSSDVQERNDPPGLRQAEVPHRRPPRR